MEKKYKSSIIKNHKTTQTFFGSIPLTLSQKTNIRLFQT